MRISPLYYLTAVFGLFRAVWPRSADEKKHGYLAYDYSKNQSTYRYRQIGTPYDYARLERMLQSEAWRDLNRRVNLLNRLCLPVIAPIIFALIYLISGGRNRYLTNHFIAIAPLFLAELVHSYLLNKFYSERSALEREYSISPASSKPNEISMSRVTEFDYDYISKLVPADKDDIRYWASYGFFDKYNVPGYINAPSDPLTWSETRSKKKLLYAILHNQYTHFSHKKNFFDTILTDTYIAFGQPEETRPFIPCAAPDAPPYSTASPEELPSLYRAALETYLEEQRALYTKEMQSN